MEKYNLKTDYEYKEETNAINSFYSQDKSGYWKVDILSPINEFKTALKEFGRVKSEIDELNRDLANQLMFKTKEHEDVINIENLISEKTKDFTKIQTNTTLLANKVRDLYYKRIDDLRYISEQFNSKRYRNNKHQVLKEIEELSTEIKFYKLCNISQFACYEAFFGKNKSKLKNLFKYCEKDYESEIECLMKDEFSFIRAKRRFKIFTCVLLGLIGSGFINIWIPIFFCGLFTFITFLKYYE